MEEFGEELKRERESRGIALKEITQATKISNRHLVALENDDFGRLPGGVFNKGIVRSYARVVGLDEEAWVARYLSAYQHSGAVSEDDMSWFAFAENVGKARAEQRDRPAQRLRWAGVFVLLTVLAVVAYFVYGYVHQRVALMPVHAAQRSWIRPGLAALPGTGFLAAAGNGSPLVVGRSLHSVAARQCIPPTG